MSNGMPNIPLAENDGIEKWQLWKKKRYIIAILAFFGYCTEYALRSSLSVTIIGMSGERGWRNNSMEPEFNWTNEYKGHILSSFFYGYLTSQIISGYIARAIGGRTLFASGVAVSGILTIATPWLVRKHDSLVIVIRVLEGIFEGFTSPSLYQIWTKWAPPLERNTLVTICFCGTYAGVLFAMPAGAYLTARFGWATVFYSFGSIAILWSILWMRTVAESPATDRHIKKSEQMYIRACLQENISQAQVSVKSVPWKAVLTSNPFWALVFANFSQNWGFHTIAIELPLYFKDVFNSDLEKSGFLFGIPFLMQAIMTPLAGFLADWLTKKDIMSNTNVKKFCNVTGSVSQVICMTCLALCKTETSAIIALSVCMGMAAIQFTSYSVLALEMGPQYASVLMGVSNTIATLSGILNPTLTGYIVSSNPTSQRWNAVFFISAFIYLAATLHFAIFASSHRQPWQRTSKCAMLRNQRPTYPNSKTSEQHPSWKVWKRRRYVVALMAFCGFFNAYILRVNLSIAIVAMTDDKYVTLENGTRLNMGPVFDWNNELQGHILSAFFYGYMATQILGGYVATKLGGKSLFGIGIFVTAAFTLVTPWIVETHVYLFIAVRVIEGLCEGVTYPCIHAVWSKWAPPLERARLATLSFSGCFVGTVIAMPACAYLADAMGWESVFYICGASGVLWFISWVIFISESPESDRYISSDELVFIQNSLSSAPVKSIGPVPWKAILTSKAVWAIVISHCGENWGFYTLLTQLPKYLKDIYDYDLGKSGFLSALPYLVMAILIQFSGQWADWFLVKGILTTTQVRKIFNCTGFLAQTVFMLITAFWSDRIGSVFCLTMAVGIGAFAWAGFSVNHLDIAPQYASILMGIGNTFATIPGIISPVITGYIVKKPATVDQWQTVFFIAGGLYLFGAIFYGTFASGELQPWAKEEKQTSRVENKIGVENNGFENYPSE
ncbi:uncharacterized protein LOC132696344 [Cylas formicarius]|uniref:uncharacterized protein LOC132696344 n=1 Tax=Cylas formicarius TaxID=197179 RepID=UPI00295840F2|nr:uncharacterized protein LOC132696344 [Cylas formicarius]